MLLPLSLLLLQPPRWGSWQQQQHKQQQHKQQQQQQQEWQLLSL